MAGESDVAELADMSRLLGDTSRLRIVLACLDGPIAVSDIAQQLDLSPSLVSHHLRLLRVARVVKADRQGKQVFYAAAADVAMDRITRTLTDRFSIQDSTLQVEKGARRTTRAVCSRRLRSRTPIERSALLRHRTESVVLVRLSSVARGLMGVLSQGRLSGNPVWFLKYCSGSRLCGNSFAPSRS